MYLLDTNTCIHIINKSSESLVKKFRQQNPNEIALCSVVKGELLYGAYHSSRPAENLRLLNKFFEPFISYAFDDTCSEIYGRIRDDLARKGTPIGPNDLMIASIALVNEITLVTANRREFSRVVGLFYESWEAPPPHIQ